MAVTVCVISLQTLIGECHFSSGTSVVIWKSIMPELNINFFPYPLQFVIYNDVALTEVLSACY